MRTVHSTVRVWAAIGVGVEGAEVGSNVPSFQGLVAVWQEVPRPARGRETRRRQRRPRGLVSYFPSPIRNEPSSLDLSSNLIMTTDNLRNTVSHANRPVSSCLTMGCFSKSW